MAVDDSEKKSRAILEARAESGKEFQQFQEAQGQLLNIQAEQRNNLNQQRVASGMEAQNNQTLEQAAEILAANSGGAAGMVAAPVVQPQITAPGTNAVLKKYGIGKPGTKTVSNTQQVQSPQKISITNNTTTTNNNNIQLTQPQIPMPAPVIPMRTGNSGGDTAKFKAWISNAFAKQNEAAAIREKEYQKREWSLTRSANKMIRKMGELGKSFAETMSPKNLGNVMGDQFKTIMFMLGFQFLASNFDKVLGAVDKVANFLTKVGKGGLSGIFDDFGEKVKKFIGGKEGETFPQAIKGLFDDIVDRFGDKLEILLESRGKAIKEVKFPEIDLSEGLGSIVTSLGNYLGDLMSAAFSGTKGLSKNLVRTTKEAGKTASLEHYDDKYSHTQDATSLIKNGRDVSYGDAVMANKDFKRNFKMAESDYGSFGRLSNNTGAGVKQGQYLSNLLEDAKAGKSVNLNQFISGFSALKKTASSKNGVLVPLNTIRDICNFFNIPEEYGHVVSLCRGPILVRYIVVDKTENDLEQENAGSFGSAAGKEYINQKGVRSVANLGGDFLGIEGNTTSTGLSVKRSFKKGNYVEGFFKGGIIDWATGGLGSTFTAGAASELRRLSSDKKRLKMVRVDDDRYPVSKYPTALDKNENPLIDTNGNEYYELTSEAIRYIETKAGAKSKSEISFDSDTTEQIKNLSNIMKNYSGSTGVDEKYEDKILRISELEAEERNEMAAFDINHSDDRIAALGTNIKQAADDIEDWVKEKYSDVKEYFGAPVPIKEGEQRKNALYIMNRLMKDLGLTKEQAAGLVGNLMAESSLNPTAVNPNGKARGIAQWLGKRRDNFKKKYNKEPNEASLEDQVDFLIDELKTTHSNFVNLAKSSKSSDVTAMSDLATGHFEFSVGIDGIKERANDPNNKYRQNYQEIIDSLSNRRKYSRNVLKTYEDSINNKESDTDTVNNTEEINEVALITDPHDADLLKNYTGLSKHDLEQKLIKEGTFNIPTASNNEDGDSYFYDTDYVEKLVSKKYFKDNLAKDGGVHQFDAMGIITDLLKNSPIANSIRSGKLKDEVHRFSNSDEYGQQFFAISRLAKILGKLDHNHNPTADEIQQILSPYISKLNDTVNNPVLSSNIWYHLQDDQKQDLIKEFTRRGNFWNGDKKIDNFTEVRDWYRHLDTKYDKLKAAELLYDKYKTTKFDVADIKHQIIGPLPHEKYLTPNNTTEANVDYDSNSTAETGLSITPQTTTNASLDNKSFIETGDIEFTSTNNQSKIDAIARSSAESAQIQMALDNNDLLAAVNHNITVLGKQMTITNELLVQQNYITYAKGGPTYIPYSAPSTSTNNLPPSNLS